MKIQEYYLLIQVDAKGDELPMAWGLRRQHCEDEKRRIEDSCIMNTGRNYPRQLKVITFTRNEEVE